MISIMSALIFFLISSPELYKITSGLLGKWIAGPTGCPTAMGLVLHTIVFFLITWGLMNVKKLQYDEKKAPSCKINKSA